MAVKTDLPLFPLKGALELHWTVPLTERKFSTTTGRLLTCLASAFGSFQLQAESSKLLNNYSRPDKRFFRRLPRAGTELSESPLKKRLKKKDWMICSMSNCLIRWRWVRYHRRGLPRERVDGRVPGFIHVGSFRPNWFWGSLFLLHTR